MCFFFQFGNVYKPIFVFTPTIVHLEIQNRWYYLYHQKGLDEYGNCQVAAMVILIRVKVSEDTNSMDEDTYQVDFQSPHWTPGFWDIGEVGQVCLGLIHAYNIAKWQFKKNLDITFLINRHMQQFCERFNHTGLNFSTTYHLIWGSCIWLAPLLSQHGNSISFPEH